MKVRAYLSVGYANAHREEVLDLEDGLSEDEIEQTVKDWKDNYIEWSFERLNEDDCA